MGLLVLHIDLTGKILRHGLTEEGTFDLPDFNQEDTVSLEVYAMKRVSYGADANHFSRVSLSGYSLKASVGSAASILATNETWSATSDGYGLEGELDLSTAGIDALADKATVLFELKLTSGTSIYRVQRPVRVLKSVALSASLNPVVNDTALGRNEAKLRFVPKQGLKELVMEDSSTGVPHLIRIVDGVLLADPIV